MDDLIQNAVLHGWEGHILGTVTVDGVEYETVSGFEMTGSNSEPYTLGVWRDRHGHILSVEPVSAEDAEMMERLFPNVQEGEDETP